MAGIGCEAERTFSVLRGKRKLSGDKAVLFSDSQGNIQMAEPEKPENEFQLGRISGIFAELSATEAKNFP